MPPEDGTTGQAPAGGQGTPGTTTTTDPGSAGAGGGEAPVVGPDGQPFDPARAMRTIETLRGFETKSKEQERELAELRTKLKEHEDAKLTESEKLTNRVTELEAEKSVWDRERQEMRVGTALREAAAKAGAHYPDAVERLVDLTKIEFEADGKPKGLDKIVEGVKASYPALFGNAKPGSADGGARPNSGAGTASEMDQRIRQAAGRA